MLRYAIKHAVAACAVVCSIVALTVLAYFGLLIWAFLSNSPPGSPAVLPFWMLVALVSSLVAVLAVFWPVTSIIGVVCRKLRNWHPLTAIPVVVVLLFVELVSLGYIYAMLLKQPVIRSMMHGTIAGLVLLIPLGIYWCSLQATDWIIGKCRLVWGCCIKSK